VATKEDVAAARRVLQIVANWRHDAVADPEEFARRERLLSQLEELLNEALGLGSNLLDAGNGSV
jgi:hypothetical protein